MKPQILFIILALLSFSCKSSQTSLEDYQGKKLVLANGGGFTGQMIEYIILENGEVFKTNSLDNSVIKVRKLAKELVSQIFANYEVLDLANLNLNQPGNMYFIIKLEEEGNSKELKWNTESSGDAVKKAKLFYQTTLGRVKKTS